MEEGLLLVLSGPSGVGKGTVCRHLVSLKPRVRLSVSVTTRRPRPGEMDGREYCFVSEEHFKSLAAGEAFLEWAAVHDCYYGTLNSTVAETLAGGADLILEIDVQGAGQVRRKRPDAVFVFLAPPSMEDLAARISGRGTENAGIIRQRLAVARREMAAYTAYDYLVVNDRVDQAAAALGAIIEAEKCRVSRGARPPARGGDEK